MSVSGVQAEIPDCSPFLSKFRPSKAGPALTSPHAHFLNNPVADAASEAASITGDWAVHSFLTATAPSVQLWNRWSVYIHPLGGSGLPGRNQLQDKRHVDLE